MIGMVIIALVSYLTSQNNNSEPVPTISESSQIPSPIPSPIDARASFVIYTNGTLRVFTDPRYHNLSQDVYIEADNPSIIHVKKRETTWADFFGTLPMKLSAECLTTGTGQRFCTNERQKLKFYLNGELKPDALEEVIKDGDELFVSFGDEE